MSALTSLFTSMANKIRSKVGGSDTYTPTEMVSAIDDVYDAGVASATTPITPSNASPASMTSGTGYKPTANGYAISSYDSVTPSSTPESVASGDIVKIGGSGVIVDAIPTPTSITPSDSSPVALTANTPVNPTTSGYAIFDYHGIAPTGNTSVQMYPNYIYKANGYCVAINSLMSMPIQDYMALPLYKDNFYRIDNYNGYAIKSYSSKTPDDDNPPSVAGGEFVQAGSNGYLYKTVQTGVATGTVAIAATTSTEYTINTGITNLTRFGLHAYSNKSYGKTMQFYNQWDSSDPTNQYVLSKYSSNGGNNYIALSSTAIATAITIESVTDGVVKIKSPSNTNWNDLSLEWWAW